MSSNGIPQAEVRKSAGVSFLDRTGPAGGIDVCRWTDLDSYRRHAYLVAIGYPHSLSLILRMHHHRTRRNSVQPSWESTDPGKP